MPPHYGFLIISTFLTVFITICSGHKGSKEIVKSPPLETIVKGFGYPFENHTVTTEDGWILTTGRIPFNGRRGNCTKKKGVILLTHGIYNNADIFVYLGPNKSIGLMLADLCYDVWLANARGTRYTSHKKYNKGDKEFWNYSFDELALYDTPALLKYITHTSGEQKIHYLGHSQGTSQILALLTLKPEYQKYIVSLHLAAPIAFLSSVTNYPQWLPRAIIGEMLQFAPELVYRPNPDAGGLGRDMVFDSCLRKDTELKTVCDIVAIYSGKDNWKWAIHFPDLISMKVLGHYAQQQLYDNFQSYNYGPKNNLEKYGSAKPPTYPIEKLHSPVHVYNALGDDYSHHLDVQRLLRRLPNLKSHNFVNRTDFGHLDFTLSSSVISKVFQQPLIENLANYS